MDPTSVLLALALAYATVAICLRTKYGYTGSQLPLPPGPPADLILGHARYMPRLYPWKTFSDWGKRWGECSLINVYPCAHALSHSGSTIYIHVLGKPIIIINDLVVARELMDRRGSIYSDRPRYVLFREMHVSHFSQTLFFLCL